MSVSLASACFKSGVLQVSAAECKHWPTCQNGSKKKETKNGRATGKFGVHSEVRAACFGDWPTHIKVLAESGFSEGPTGLPRVYPMCFSEQGQKRKKIQGIGHRMVPKKPVLCVLPEAISTSEYR